MSETTPDTPLPKAERVRSPMRAFWGITKEWLTAPDRGNARWLILWLVLLTVGQVAIQIRLNLWNRDFFNALENRDFAAFRWQMLVFLGLAVGAMLVAVYQLYTKQLIQSAKVVNHIPGRSGGGGAGAARADRDGASHDYVEHDLSENDSEGVER